MRILRSLLVLLLGQCLAAASSAATYESLYAQWKAKQYDAVLPELLDYRREPGGRTWRVDYMIGTSGCHARTPWPDGQNYLREVLVYKDLTDQTRAMVKTELQFCENHVPTAAAADTAFSIVPITSQVADQPAIVYGKGGFIASSSPPHSADRQFVSPVSRQELQQRLVEPGQEQAAIASAVARLGGGRGVAVPGLIVVCGWDCGEELGQKEARCLTDYRRALRDAFDMQPPARPVTVYVPEDPAQIGNAAKQIHGVQLPPGTIAYSVPDDMSIVGPASPRGCGSLAHEWVHLAIRGNFGDSPAWLEEGLASEIAVSRLDAQKIRFGWSWRDEVVASHLNLRPSIDNLLSSTWADFTASGTSLDKVAVLHGTAAAFVRFLDARGRLRSVYFAIRDGRFGTGSGEFRTDVQILEQELDMPATRIESEFTSWFQSEIKKAHPPCRAAGPAQTC
jgi:hypothetical protein